MLKQSVLNNYLDGNWEDLDKHDLLQIIDYLETIIKDGEYKAQDLIINNESDL